MMKTRVLSAAREISHWRHFFRTRDAALRRAGTSSLPFERDDTHPDTLYPPTEWAETEWPDTNIEAPAR
ncbi:MAG: hypothetical protein KIT35_29045 [Piscinibacter sp.]|uniref:hypothetical protein n=1 Tax=Piscinibacter TaxID=1114981 RepID=UPI000FDE02B1|nr:MULTISPECIES: hypothetical protein [Piscinibacter]MCW5667902.1 hypothetical protein [Piscinibacter sp.]